MKELKINFKKALQKDINLIAEYFKKGSIIIYPTDTIYGIGCLATNKKAINKIYKIKKREAGKPLLILISSLAMLKKYYKINNKQMIFLKKIWGKNFRPITVILKSKNNLPKELAGENHTIAVRLPKNDFLIKLIKIIKYPIVSTSANISGKEYNEDIKKIGKLFGGKIDLIVDAGQLKNKPSKIIDITDIENIRILRK